MSNHTPGPWHQEANTQECDDRGGFFVCHPETVCEDTAICMVEEEADANLIAAAPDMLEALENIENDDGSIPAGIWDLAEKAIAKAKGQSNG